MNQSVVFSASLVHALREAAHAVACGIALLACTLQAIQPSYLHFFHQMSVYYTFVRY